MTGTPFFTPRQLSGSFMGARQAKSGPGWSRDFQNLVRKANSEKPSKLMWGGIAKQPIVYSNGEKERAHYYQNNKLKEEKCK